MTFTIHIHITRVHISSSNTKKKLNKKNSSDAIHSLCHKICIVVINQLSEYYWIFFLEALCVARNGNIIMSVRHLIKADKQFLKVRRNELYRPSSLPKIIKGERKNGKEMSHLSHDKIINFGNVLDQVLTNQFYS